MMDDKTDPSDQRQRAIPYIVIALIVWGTLLAVGTFVFRGEYDFRKPLIVLACVWLFVGFWGLMLWVHRRRLKRGSRTRDE